MPVSDPFLDPGAKKHFSKTIYRLLCVCYTVFTDYLSKDREEKLERDNKKLENKINSLKKYINKTFECVSILFDFPIERLKRIVNNFVRGNKENDKQRNSDPRNK